MSNCEECENTKHCLVLESYGEQICCDNQNYVPKVLQSEDDKINIMDNIQKNAHKKGSLQVKQ